MTLLAKAVVTATLIVTAAGAQALGVGDVSDYNARPDAPGVTLQTGLQGSAHVVATGTPTRVAPLMVVVPADAPVIVMTAEQALPAARSLSSTQPLAYGDVSGYPYRLGLAPAGTRTAGLASDSSVPVLAGR